MPRQPIVPDSTTSSTEAGKSFWITLLCGRYPISLGFNPSPSTMRPDAHGINPSSAFISVVLPEPFSPMMPQNSPDCTEKLTSCATLSPP